MKTSLSLLLLFLHAAVCLADERPARLAPAALEEAIVKASQAIHTANDHEAELAKLRARSRASKRSIQVVQWARLQELEAESQSAVAAFDAVKAQLRVGDAILSYPGLLALGQVTYSETTRAYTLRIVDGWSPYEDSITVYRRVYKVVFASDGRIAEHGREPVMQTR